MDDASTVSAPASAAEWAIFTALMAMLYVTVLVTFGNLTVVESVGRGVVSGTTMALVVAVVVFAWRGLTAQL